MGDPEHASDEGNLCLLRFRACSMSHVLNSFAETEAVAVLTLLVSQYKIDIKDEPQFASETFEQKKARVLKSNVRFTV